jgi:hypothetical protein
MMTPIAQGQVNNVTEKEYYCSMTSEMGSATALKAARPLDNSSFKRFGVSLNHDHFPA